MTMTPVKIKTMNAGWRFQFRFRSWHHLPGVCEFFR